MQEPIYNLPPRNTGEALDKLLSTPDNVFNDFMQKMIWQHTKRGDFIPDSYVIAYMELLYDVYFFCRDNRAKPFVCRDHIVDKGDNYETVLALTDAVLHLISRQWEDFQILAGQLIEFRNTIAPYMEDEEVLVMMKEMEDERWEFWPRPPLSWTYSTASKKQISDTPTITDQAKLSHAQIAILYQINQWPITDNNAKEIARRYGQTSGQKLRTTYDSLSSELVRTGKGKYTVKNYKIIELLVLPGRKPQYDKELEDARRNNKK